MIERIVECSIWNDGGDWRYWRRIGNELRGEIEKGVEFAKESEMMLEI